MTVSPLPLLERDRRLLLTVTKAEFTLITETLGMGKFFKFIRKEALKLKNVNQAAFMTLETPSEIVVFMIFSIVSTREKRVMRKQRISYCLRKDFFNLQNYGILLRVSV